LLSLVGSPSFRGSGSFPLFPSSFGSQLLGLLHGLVSGSACILHFTFVGSATTTFYHHRSYLHTCLHYSYFPFYAGLLPPATYRFLRFYWFGHASSLHFLRVAPFLPFPSVSSFLPSDFPLSFLPSFRWVATTDISPGSFRSVSWASPFPSLGSPTAPSPTTFPRLPHLPLLTYHLLHHVPLRSLWIPSFVLLPVVVHFYTYQPFLPSPFLWSPTTLPSFIPFGCWFVSTGSFVSGSTTVLPVPVWSLPSVSFSTWATTFGSYGALGHSLHGSLQPIPNTSHLPSSACLHFCGAAPAMEITSLQRGLLTICSVSVARVVCIPFVMENLLGVPAPFPPLQVPSLPLFPFGSLPHHTPAFYHSFPTTYHFFLLPSSLGLSLPHVQFLPQAFYHPS